MGFDARSFIHSTFEARTAEVRIPELAPFFDGAEPVFKVRGLSGIELAQCTEAAGAQKMRADLVASLIDGSDEERTKALLESFGLGAHVPGELVRYHELIIRGTVEPVIDRETSVLLATRYPVDHRGLALKIMELTGAGQLCTKKKPSVSTPAETSAPA